MWFIAIIAVEALVELITTASIFEMPRARLMSVSKFTEELLSCGYCTSVWIAALFAWSLPGYTGYPIVDIVLKTLALHRLSNFVHEIRAWWTNGIQLNHLVHSTEKEEVNG